MAEIYSVFEGKFMNGSQEIFSAEPEGIIFAEGNGQEAEYPLFAQRRYQQREKGFLPKSSLQLIAECIAKNIHANQLDLEHSPVGFSFSPLYEKFIAGGCSGVTSKIHPYYQDELVTLVINELKRVEEASFLFKIGGAEIKGK